MRLLPFVAALALAMVGFAQAPASGAWLETSPTGNWNTPGAAVPMAPPPAGGTSDPRCGSQERPAESPEEDQVVAAGWHIFNAARVGWGVRVVDGLVDYDGMCRPNHFQAFVFADGVFAGTIAPAPMNARTDGSGRVIDVHGPDGAVSAQFVRYTPADALCCPSSVYQVEYGVDRSGDAPVLVPLSSRRINVG
jgi:hypothetical protein